MTRIFPTTLGFCLCCFFLVTVQSNPTVIEWAWLFGNNSIGGVYGEMGNASISYFPSGRYGAVGGFDSTRREFWVFGGSGYDSTGNDGFLNDLWRYRVDDSTWTWVSGCQHIFKQGLYGEQGIASINNCPGSRYDAVGWFDSTTQEFWVFGGRGKGNSSDNGFLNDLWRYQVNDSTWTWVAGSSDIDQPGEYGEKGSASTANIPPSRRYAAGCYDSLRQEFWLFGGQSIIGYLNDLWRYRVNDSTWTWLSGDSFVIQPLVVGEHGSTNIETAPSARIHPGLWFDSTRQELWLFGGKADNNKGYLNDLWKYRVIDNTWIWISGTNATDQLGEYGEKGEPSKNNYPGGRAYPIGWFDSTTQELWLFGGKCPVNNSTDGYLNDLWRYRVNDSTWTWMSGSITTDQLGIKGDKGESSPNYVPGAREGALGWYDSTNQEFWLFGGRGFSHSGSGKLNDIWKLSWNLSEYEPMISEPETELCPPLHQHIDNDCVPLIQCPVDESTSQCVLQCYPSSLTNTSSCLIEGDMVVNGSVMETKTIAIVGVINVTGDVTVAGEKSLLLSPGTVLHVGKCLVLEEGSEIVVVVDGADNTHGSVLVTYDEDCPSQLARVNIEASLSLDECRDGIPVINEQREDGRAKLELLFLPSDSSQCRSESNGVNWIAISIAVPIAALAVVALVLIFAHPKIRSKVFPFANSKRKRIVTM